MNGRQANSKYLLIFKNIFALSKMLAANTIFLSNEPFGCGCDLQNDACSASISSTVNPIWSGVGEEGKFTLLDLFINIFRFLQDIDL